MSAELSETVVREALAATAQRAYALRIQTGNGGNLSARLPGGAAILVKARGTSFDLCTPESFVTVTLDGTARGGVPSVEVETHLAIYRARPAVNAVFHAHAPWSVACADTGGAIPNVTPHSVQKLGSIPVLDVSAAVDHDRAIAVAATALLDGDPSVTCFVERRHGLFSFAGDLQRAFHNAELIEETAQIALLIKLAAAREAAA